MVFQGYIELYEYEACHLSRSNFQIDSRNIVLDVGYCHTIKLTLIQKAYYFENIKKGESFKSLQFEMQKAKAIHKLPSFVLLLSPPIDCKIPFINFLLTMANRNWQKMCHLGSPANKRCAILRAGMFAIVTMATN